MFIKAVKVSSWIILVGVIIFLFTQVAPLLPLYDYLEYWTAGFLNRTGSNPYGLLELQELQNQMGWKYPEPLLAWNPPWILSIMMLLSLLPYHFSRVSWLFTSILIVLYSARKTWLLYNGSAKQGLLILLLAISFSPVFFNLLFGQITPLILLGIIAFLACIEHQPQNRIDQFLAGFFISFTMIKPQLLYLVPVALLFWSIHKRSQYIFLGFTSAIVLFSFSAWIVNPEVFRQYYIAITQYPPNYWATPTIGFYLRNLFGFKLFWLQFMPVIPGIAWLGLYWYKNAKHWNWSVHLPMVLLVSVCTASYSWVHDQIILIPLLILALIWATQGQSLPYKKVIIFAYFSANLAYLILHFKWDDSVFVWIAPLFLLLFLPIHTWLKRRYPVS